MQQITGEMICSVSIPCEGAYEEQHEPFVGGASKRRTIKGHLDCNPDEKPKRRTTPMILDCVTNMFRDARNVSSAIDNLEGAGKQCNNVSRMIGGWERKIRVDVVGAREKIGELGLKIPI